VIAPALVLLVAASAPAAAAPLADVASLVPDAVLD